MLLRKTKILVEEMYSNTWKKIGILLQPKDNVWWMSHYCGPTFAEVMDDKIMLYVVGRDGLGISRIGLVELNVENPLEIISISKNID